MKPKPITMEELMAMIHEEYDSSKDTNSEYCDNAHTENKPNKN